MYKNKQSEAWLPYMSWIDEINKYDHKSMSDVALSETMRRSASREIVDENYLFVYSLLKEVVYRLLGLKLFDTQLATAISLYRGRIAEMPTGEGKTLAAVLAAIVFSLGGQRVHVFTFNDYLAQRDYELTRPIYEFCGLNPGFINQSMDAQQRKDAYQCDVVYLTVKESGFDYLRDFLCLNSSDLSRQTRDVAIIDEADSILIDEARIPLIIAGTAPDSLALSDVVNHVKNLTPAEVLVDKELNQAWLTDHGLRTLESKLNIENIYHHDDHTGTLTIIDVALQAQFLLDRDRDYIVRDNSIKIVDEFTGRVAENRRYPDLLHCAVEAKENLPASLNSRIYNSITVQHYLGQYKTLCGMTGTIQTSAREIRDVYGLEIDIIPPHAPNVRIDHDDVLYFTKADKYTGIIDEIIQANSKGQPVLVGTQTVQESEILSSMLVEQNIVHSVLNAKNDQLEAELISKAGEPYRVTVSTNMAGRGVDIKLGGQDELHKAMVESAAGLYVIGTNRHDSVRVDNQLRGRAGRQGDVGESRFYLSLEDDLLVKYKIQDLLPESSLKQTNLRTVSDKQVLAAVGKIQRFSQGANADAREMLNKYSYILEDQRKIVTALRNDILLGNQRPQYLATRDPLYYQELVSSAGERAVHKAEKQLTLYFINQHWADYQEYMAEVRESIHLTVLGGKSPIDQYHRRAVSAFDIMRADIENDIINSMKSLIISADGIDMDAAGLGGATTTWTYLINDSSSQFSNLPQIVGTISHQIRGSLFSASSLLNRVKDTLGIR